MTFLAGKILHVEIFVGQAALFTKDIHSDSEHTVRLKQCHHDPSL